MNSIFIEDGSLYLVFELYNRYHKLLYHEDFSIEYYSVSCNEISFSNLKKKTTTDLPFDYFGYLINRYPSAVFNRIW